MKLLLKDCESDNSVVVGLERLKDKALITISKDNVISMHDIIQELGREIVRQESRGDLRKHSRLWDSDEICDVLKNDKVKNYMAFSDSICNFGQNVDFNDFNFLFTFMAGY
jgi:hypothetical protein